MARLCSDYSSTRDCFAYILVCAPGPFLGNKTTTLESIFEDMDEGVATMEARAQHPDAVATFSECRKKLRSSYQLYKEGNAVDARKEVRLAEQLFVAAGKLKRTRSSSKAPNITSSYRRIKSRDLRLDGATVTAATSIAPALIVQRFGTPCQGDGYKISGEFAFINDEDNAFILHDWLSTSLYTGSEPTPEQFWASLEEYELRVSSLDLDCTEFLEWLANEVIQ